MGLLLLQITQSSDWHFEDKLLKISWLKDIYQL
jgi:hypothetical protein